MQALVRSVALATVVGSNSSRGGPRSLQIYKHVHSRWQFCRNHWQEQKLKPTTQLFLSFTTFVSGSLYKYMGLDTSHRRIYLEELRVKATTAIRKNKQRELKSIMEEAAWIGDVELRDSLGRTLLMLAASGGKLPLLKCIIEFGADIKACDMNGMSVLEHASWKNQVFVVQHLLQDRGVSPDCNADIFGMFPLHKAAGYGHDAVVDTLLQAGADINQVTEDCTAPESYEAHSKRETALAIASRLGYYDVMRRLVAHPKCHLNKQDRNGDTALHHAMRKRDWRATEILVNAGASRSIKNLENKTCLDVASPTLAAAVRAQLIRLFPSRLVSYLEPS
eukprot:gene4059-6478_t